MKIKNQTYFWLACNERGSSVIRKIRVMESGCAYGFPDKDLPCDPYGVQRIDKKRINSYLPSNYCVIAETKQVCLEEWNRHIMFNIKAKEDELKELRGHLISGKLNIPKVLERTGLSPDLPFQLKNADDQLIKHPGTGEVVNYSFMGAVEPFLFVLGETFPHYAELLALGYNSLQEEYGFVQQTDEGLLISI